MGAENIPVYKPLTRFLTWLLLSRALCGRNDCSCVLHVSVLRWHRFCDQSHTAGKLVPGGWGPVCLTMNGGDLLFLPHTRSPFCSFCRVLSWTFFWPPSTHLGTHAHAHTYTHTDALFFRAQETLTSSQHMKPCSGKTWKIWLPTICPIF